MILIDQDSTMLLRYQLHSDYRVTVPARLFGDLGISRSTRQDACEVSRTGSSRRCRAVKRQGSKNQLRKTKEKTNVVNH